MSGPFYSLDLHNSHALISLCRITSPKAVHKFWRWPQSSEMISKEALSTSDFIHILCRERRKGSHVCTQGSEEHMHVITIIR